MIKYTLEQHLLDQKWKFQLDLGNQQLRLVRSMGLVDQKFLLSEKWKIHNLAYNTQLRFK